MSEATETMLECMRGPMDGALVDPSAVGKGAIRISIASRMLSLLDGTRLLVWQPALPNQAEFCVVYEQRPEGRPHHLHYVSTERAKTT